MNVKRFIFSFFFSILFTSLLMAAPVYVGDKTCVACHAPEHKQWQGSHHDLAMQEANESTVIGNFEKALFVKHGVSTQFYKRDGHFMVNTDGPDGKLQDYIIRYTFGVYPLQQYMVEFTGGRIQVLDIAWDSRPKVDGGQRWFSLHPSEEIKSGDVLHWTGPNLNWNYMCADCHSTNVKKNYSPLTKNYDTQWSSIDVSCEACHGPASQHLVWANTQKNNPHETNGQSNGLTVHLSSQNEAANNNRHWAINTVTGKPELNNKNTINNNVNEIEVCARCHARRSQFDDNFVPGDNFRDHYLPALLSDDLYFADGKIKDEVYVYGSFQQSRMYKQGVRCSDCHNSHTLELKAEGNKVCTQCHLANKYTDKTHHFHENNSVGSRCTSCHMPARTYMGVDERHDHSFRIPRPDIATQLDLPDACTACHKDKKSDWAANKIKSWYGYTPEGFQTFAHTLRSIDQQTEDALSNTYQLLQTSAPAIAKATVVGFLGNYPSQQTLTTGLQMLRSKDADTRRQALIALESFPLRQTIKDIYHALNDPIKMVRMEAARILLTVPRGNLSADQKILIERVTGEYHQSLLFIAERPEAQLSLAQFYQQLGQYDKAETAYHEALRLQPQYVPAYINYANFLQTTDLQAAFNVLNTGLSKTNDAALHHALGLWYVRNKQKNIGIASLKIAANMDLDNVRFQYVYAVAVGETDPQKAIILLDAALQNHGGRMDLLSAIAAYHLKLGDKKTAERYQKKINDLLRPSFQRP